MSSASKPERTLTVDPTLGYIPVAAGVASSSGAFPTTVKMTPDEVKDHFRVPEMEGYYLLLCDGPPVTVQSQQVRALNLLHALAPDPEKGNEIRDKRIAVIGGGAAGITFAARADA